MILNSDNTVNRSPRWMPKSRMSTEEVVEWPTQKLGVDAICVVISQWQAKSNGFNEVAGLYNAPCDGLYYTNPLCQMEL